MVHHAGGPQCLAGWVMDALDARMSNGKGVHSMDPLQGVCHRIAFPLHSVEVAQGEADPGVVFDFPPSSGTGAGRNARHLPEIGFSEPAMCLVLLCFARFCHLT